MKQVERIFSELSLEEKIGQMFMVGFPGETIPDEVKKFMNDNNIGFADIFARNIVTVEQTVNLMNDIHSQAKIPPMIFTDQEGGIVCQFAELASTYSSHMGLAATGNPSFTELAAKHMAEDLDLLGLDGFIAPTMDVNYEANNPIIGVRSFSDDVQTVIESGRAFINGVNQTGLAAIPKHFPGHGGSVLDSHLVLPSMNFSEEYFENCDLKPFEAIAKEVDFMMTAHIAVPSIDPLVVPATFSEKFLIDILRDKFGFKGVLVSDCLEMGVIKNNYTPEEIIINFVNAGGDVMLLSHSIDLQQELYKIFVEKVRTGEISEARVDESVKRILAVKEKYAALTDRKQRSVSSALSCVRKKREIEDLICRHTIVVLRNKLKKLPLQKDQKLGIIEWDKTRSTIQINEPAHKSYLEDFARQYFREVEVMILPLKKPDFSKVKDFIKKCDNLLVSPFSRAPELEMIQADVIREILKIREDAIVIATGNPYDIRYFQDVKTYIVTFGFRDSQMQALFDALVGKYQPTGKLPVKIDGIFPRWHKSN